MSKKRKAPSQTTTVPARRTKTDHDDDEHDDGEDVAECNTPNFVVRSAPVMNYPTSSRIINLYRVTFRDPDPQIGVEASEDEGEGDSAPQQGKPGRRLLGNYLTLREANAVARKKILSYGFDDYAEEAFPDGGIYVSGSYLTTGNFIKGCCALVEKETVVIPELYIVLKRRANTTMTPGEISTVGTYICFAAAEEAVQKEIKGFQARMKAGEKSPLDFDIVQRKGNGKNIFSKGIVEFKDLRDEFPVVWVETLALDAEGAEKD